MIEFYFKAVWDALRSNANRVERVFDCYQELSKTVNNFMVVNQVTDAVRGRASSDRFIQRINVSTHFGPSPEKDGGDKQTKTFYFGQGSTLLYWKPVDPNSQNNLEVMNYGSVHALVTQLLGVDAANSSGLGNNFVSDPFQVQNKVINMAGIATIQILRQNAATPYPHPLSYCLYLVRDGRSFPVSQSQLPYCAYIDTNGELSLAIYTNRYSPIYVPWSANEIPSIVGQTLYLVVNKWGNAIPGVG